MNRNEWLALWVQNIREQYNAWTFRFRHVVEEFGCVSQHPWHRYEGRAGAGTGWPLTWERGGRRGGGGAGRGGTTLTRHFCSGKLSRVRHQDSGQASHSLEINSYIITTRLNTKILSLVSWILENKRIKEKGKCIGILTQQQQPQWFRLEMATFSRDNSEPSPFSGAEGFMNIIFYSWSKSFPGAGMGYGA